MRSRWWSILLAGCVLAGCASEMSSANRLDEALRAYHHHLKAKDLERASSYVSGDAMEDFRSLHGDRRNGLQMEEFQVETVRFLHGQDRKDPLRALVLVTLEARQADSLVVRPVRLLQTWEERSGRWVLIRTGIAPERWEGADAPGSEHP